MDALEQALQDARKNRHKAGNEENTKINMILPVLQALGWKDYIDAEAPTLNNKKADFALYLSDPKKPSLLVEAKTCDNAASPKYDDVEQAQLYAFHMGVPVVVLTDGAHWHFYLVRKEGDYPERRALTLKLDDVQRIAELLPTVLGRDAVADATATAKLEELHGYEMAKGEFRPAWSRLCESQDFAESVTKLLTAELERSGTESSHDDALAFVEKQLSGKQTPLPDDNEPPSLDNVKVILTLDGKETEYDGRPAAVRGLLEWNRPDPRLLSELAKTRHAVKQTAPPQYPNGNRDYHWQQSGDYWVHTQVGAPGLQAFIGHYNKITGKSVVCTERKLP